MPGLDAETQVGFAGVAVEVGNGEAVAQRAFTGLQAQAERIAGRIAVDEVGAGFDLAVMAKRQDVIERGAAVARVADALQGVARRRRLGRQDAVGAQQAADGPAGKITVEAGGRRAVVAVAAVDLPGFGFVRLQHQV